MYTDVFVYNSEDVIVNQVSTPTKGDLPPLQGPGVVGTKR